MSIQTLPSMEHSFHLDIEGSETKQKWSGNFTYKRPNLRVKSQISRMTARLNEDLRSLDEDIVFLHRVLSTLRHTIIDSPEWWQKADFGFELYDVNVVLDIYKSIQAFENKWFDKIWKIEEHKEEPKKKKNESKK